MYVYVCICIITLWNLGTRVLISSGHKGSLNSFFLVAFFSTITFLENAKLLMQLRRGSLVVVYDKDGIELILITVQFNIFLFFEIFGDRDCTINPVGTSDPFLIFKVKLLVWFSHTLFYWGKISSLILRQIPRSKVHYAQKIRLNFLFFLQYFYHLINSTMNTNLLLADMFVRKQKKYLAMWLENSNMCWFHLTRSDILL